MASHTTTSETREVYSDFNDFERCADGTVRVSLGSQPTSTAFLPLTDVREGERVRVVLPDELEAEGVLASEHEKAGTFWYVVLPSWDAIHIVHPEAQAEPKRSSQAS